MSDPKQIASAELDDGLIESDLPEELVDYPRATPEERLTGGMRFEDMIGICPGDADDGFEEEIRALRRGFRSPDDPQP